MKIAVTGASGHLGSQVVAALTKKTSQENIIALVHNKKHAQKLSQASFTIREMDFQNEGSLQKALAGVDVLVYIASKTYTVLDRVKELENVLAAMQQAQVAKLVAMSFIADQEGNPFVMSPFYGYLPRRLAGTNLAYVILKNALYADPLGSLSARINSAQRPDLPSRTPSHVLYYAERLGGSFRLRGYFPSFAPEQDNLPFGTK